MSLRFDPLAIFAAGETAIALHVRKHYGKPDKHDRAISRQCRADILTQQQADGRWGGCAGRTINALFALWLLDQPSCEQTARGVDALLDASHPLPARSQHPEWFDMLAYRVRRAELSRMEGVPFTMGCSLFVKTGAALFFAAKFGQGDVARIEAARKVFDARAADPKRHGCWCSGPCANNIIQAYAASPDLSRGPAMRLALDYLAREQLSSGAWGRAIPFHPTVFALAQVPGESAEMQLQRAVGLLVARQNRDGSWGRSKCELRTFLVLGALRRLNVLPGPAR